MYTWSPCEDTKNMRVFAHHISVFVDDNWHIHFLIYCASASPQEQVDRWSGRRIRTAVCEPSLRMMLVVTHTHTHTLTKKTRLLSATLNLGLCTVVTKSSLAKQGCWGCLLPFLIGKVFSAPNWVISPTRILIRTFRWKKDKRMAQKGNMMKLRRVQHCKQRMQVGILMYFFLSKSCSYDGV